MNNHEELSVENLDHLGLIAGIIDELEIVRIINETIPAEKGEKISAGLVVKADLKQFIIDLICTSDGDIPLFVKIPDGNESDKAVFGE